MTDDVTPVHTVMDLLRGEVAKHHDRLNRHSTQLIVIGGEDGRGGTVAQHGEDIAEIRGDMRKHDDRLRAVEVQVAKGVMLAAAVAALAAAVVSWVLSRLG